MKAVQADITTRRGGVDGAMLAVMLTRCLVLPLSG
jgi:hypothetical protein